MKNARPTIVLSVLLLVACGTVRMYEGPARPPEETAAIHARLRADSRGWTGDVTFDVRLVGIDDRRFDEFEPRIEVLPGRYVLHFTWERWVFGAWAFEWVASDETGARTKTDEGIRSLAIDAKPGVRYTLIVPWEDSGKDWYFEERERR